jgi:hypothetical protein
MARCIDPRDDLFEREPRAARTQNLKDAEGRQKPGRTGKRSARGRSAATVRFRVQARDEKELIGDGTHERVVVNVAKFHERVQRKPRPS